MLNLGKRSRGHFVTLIKTPMHIITFSERTYLPAEAKWQVNKYSKRYFIQALIFAHRCICSLAFCLSHINSDGTNK